MKVDIPATRYTNANGRRTLFGYFVLGSLALHALLVALWHGEPADGPVGRSTFQVTLLARHGDAPDKQGAETERVIEGDARGLKQGAVVSSEHAAHTEDKPPNRVSIAASGATSKPSARAAGNRETPPDDQARNDAQERSEQAVAAALQTPDTEVEQAPIKKHVGVTSGSLSHGRHEMTSAAKYRRVRAELLKALLPYFEYPDVARRRGWQGRVRIGLLVEADGDLSHIHLVESSGYSLLDNAAVKNVTELGNVPGATQWLDDGEIDVVLPVSYRLKDR